MNIKKQAEMIYISICENCRQHALNEISQDDYKKEAKRILDKIVDFAESLNQSEAVEFTEWIIKEAQGFNISYRDDLILWDDGNRFIPTEDFYQKFKQQENGK